ncbi:CopG family ribbon-helix-helix protein [Methyloprofundus sp.]|uniref:CopG family ribbon-helix-helix protein n=1 Tax=Methyloprofundus sp. TaxID=2020875 RepID=UPI003D0DC643
METRVLTARIPLPLAEKVDDLAERIDRPKAWVVKQALAAWVAQEDERYRLTLEALAEVDQGLFIDHSEVQMWAESLDTETPLPIPHA